VGLVKTDEKFGVGVSSLRRFPLSLGHFRGFLRTSFFPKRHDHEYATPEARAFAVMVPLQLRTFFWGQGYSFARASRGLDRSWEQLALLFHGGGSTRYPRASIDSSTPRVVIRS
jgi:hypothetical protein